MSPERAFSFPNGSLLAARKELAADPEGEYPEVGRLAADAADAWLSERFGAALAGSSPTGMALLAVGGLGRRELLPGSDLDLVLVHDKRKDARRVAERIWYPIWDDNCNLDHSVRTPKEVLSAAEGDLKVALGLLDARLVVGDEKLAADVLARVNRLWQARRERWLRALMDSVAARHKEFGDVAFLLEPDLKEGRGGLRDVHALRAASKVTSVLNATVHDPPSTTRQPSWPPWWQPCSPCRALRRPPRTAPGSSSKIRTRWRTGWGKATRTRSWPAWPPRPGR